MGGLRADWHYMHHLDHVVQFLIHMALPVMACLLPGRHPDCLSLLWKKAGGASYPDNVRRRDVLDYIFCDLYSSDRDPELFVCELEPPAP